MSAATGLSNAPKILKGAFVDSNVLAIPPLVVPFQFNPETIARRKTTQIATPPSRRGREEGREPTGELGEAETVYAGPETMTLDIRLDASDELNDGDAIAGQFGVLPALSALELMVTPRSESVFAGLLGLSIDFGFGDRTSPPVVIFAWGRQRIYAVRISSMDIQEMEYNVNLNPVRATVGVSLQVIGERNAFYIFTQTQREILAAVNLRNVGDLAHSIVNF